jgi:hypothetical protein
MAQKEVRSQLTLIELAKRAGNDDLNTIAEVLHEINEFYDDALWLPSNQLLSTIIVRRNSLPTGEHRKFNAGVSASASSTTQVVEPIAMLEDYSEPDKALADMSPDKDQFLMDEDEGHIEGLTQTMMNTLIYGNRGSAPEEIDGLALRLNDISQDNVVDCSGSGSDLTSVFLVQWGKRQVHMIYPKNSPTMGIERIFLGEDTNTDSNSKKWQIYRTHLKVYYGLAVHDERCIRRLANIETAGASNLFDDDLMIEQINKLPYRGAGAVIYCNATVKSQIDKIAKDKSNVYYQPTEIFGRPTTMFRGIPIRQVDAILDTESAVT